MQNIILTVAYDGTHYLGWQKNQEGKSIEEALEKTLSQILQEKIILQAASRTDAGVHANEQIVNFFSSHHIEPKKLQMSLNALLPKDITIINVHPALTHFHPTLDCIAKEYHYYICNHHYQLPFHRNYSWHYFYPLELPLMQRSASLLIGKHDFATFCNTKKNEVYTHTVRNLTSIEIIPLPQNRICFKIVGENFLYKMVRNIIGTLVYIGNGKIPINKLSRILESCDRTQAGITAPAHGLFLHKVYYPGGIFNDTTQ
ncbi:MAG: tRNA pseudouridine(38-40) synthase TruA [Chlamydiales bacterium]|nr:tRNA pseudouridine(38-40) synthase TruA [Chlamydiales bacterium]